MTCIDTCGSQGVYTSMLVEESDLVDCDPADFGASSERYEILSESIRFTDTLLGGNGLTGTIDKIGNHTRHGARIVVGQFSLEVGPYELTNWLPRILGNSASGTTFTTDETFDLRPFDIMLKRDQGTVTYRRCSVNSATLTSTASIGGAEQVMRLTLQVLGYEEHDDTYPGSAPSLPSESRLYWLLGDGKLEMTPTGGSLTEYYFDAFSLRIDNNLTPKTRNFLSVTCVQTNGRTIKLRVRTPYTSSSHTNLYINDFKGQGVLSFLGSKNPEVPSTYSTVITLPELRQTRITPNTAGRGEIPLALDLEAYRTSSAEPITITNAHP
jgi:hypothetical protein